MIFIYSMDYLLNNYQVLPVIYKFIKDEFYDDNLDWDYDVDYETDESETNILNFFGDRYHNNDQDEWYFQYIKKEYYLKAGLSQTLSDRWLDKAPILELRDWEFCSKMNSLFGEYWKPAFEKWFSDTYPKFPVKTFLYH